MLKLVWATLYNSANCTFDSPVLWEGTTLYTYREMRILEVCPIVQTATAVRHAHCNDEQLA